MVYDPFDLPVRRTSDGFGASGPGFHVWEEDRRELIQWAAELMRDSVQPLAEAQDGQGHRRRGEQGQGPDVPKDLV